MQTMEREEGQNSLRCFMSISPLYSLINGVMVEILRVCVLYIFCEKKHIKHQLTGYSLAIRLLSQKFKSSGIFLINMAAVSFNYCPKLPTLQKELLLNHRIVNRALSRHVLPLWLLF